MRINLVQGFSQMRSQGRLGSCSAFATTSILEYLRNRIEGYTSRNKPHYSPRFVYYNSRLADEYDTAHPGVYYSECPFNKLFPRDTNIGVPFDWVKQAILEKGIRDESKFEYDKCAPEPISNGHGNGHHYMNAFCQRPPDRTGRDNENRDITEKDKYLADIVEIGADFSKWIEALKNEDPLLISIAVPDSFKAQMGSSFYDDPRAALPAHKSHAVVILGYDSEYTTPHNHKVEAFLLRNSWGSDWGENGYIWVSKRTLAHIIKSRPIVFKRKHEFKPFFDDYTKPPVRPRPTPVKPVRPSPAKGDEFMYQWWLFDNKAQYDNRFFKENSPSPRKLSSMGNVGRPIGPQAGSETKTDGYNKHHPNPGNSSNFTDFDTSLINADPNSIVGLGACRIADVPAGQAPESADGYWKWTFMPLKKKEVIPTPITGRPDESKFGRVVKTPFRATGKVIKKIDDAR